MDVNLLAEVSGQGSIGKIIADIIEKTQEGGSAKEIIGSIICAALVALILGILSFLGYTVKKDRDEHVLEMKKFDRLLESTSKKAVETKKEDEEPKG